VIAVIAVIAVIGVLSDVEYAFFCNLEQSERSI